MFARKTSRAKRKNVQNSEKVVIDEITDLLRLPIHKILQTQLSNFSGNYFKKIYDEAINLEDKPEKKEKKEIIPLKKKDIEIDKKKIPKPRKPKEKKKNISNIIDTSPTEHKLSKSNDNVVPKKMKIKRNKSSEKLKKSRSKEKLSKSISMATNKPKKKTKKNKKKYKGTNDFLDIDLTKPNKNFKTDIINPLDPLSNNSSSEKKNNMPDQNIFQNVTPFPYDRPPGVFNQFITPFGNEIINNKINNAQIDINAINQKQNIFKKESDNILYPLNKIIFCLTYNSVFGEEVGIVGSIEKLGNWEEKSVKTMKWNKGNIWIRELELNPTDLVDFEFKFVVLERNKIKKWESGNNNIVNFTGLINEFQSSTHGRYNKYEYEYNPNTGELTIKCYWRK